MIAIRHSIGSSSKLLSNTLQAIFSAAGYEVRMAYSVEQAIEIIAGWQPDLALLDAILPIMNGIDLAVVLTI